DRWRVLIPTGLLLGLTVLSHPANALLLSPTILTFVGLVALLDRRRLGPAAALAGVALGFAFVAYYQVTVPRVFGEVLPRILEKLQTSGGVGQNPAVLGAPLLGGFWPQLAAHFQIWPVALGGAALLSGARWARRSAAPTLRPSAGRGLWLWLGATTLVFALFSVVDLWINLLQKHMIYFMPFLALLSGLALASLWRRGHAAQLLCLLLWVALALVSVVAWQQRVVNYVLPPGTG
ncbi:MAG TPA: hypothetical protein VM536_08510, partial [Chloroflexia bacterium]|nr:hypothetical protein [Chloroflexia bacterium]